MEDNVKLTGLIDIPILNKDCIIDDVQAIIDKHINCKLFTISSVTYNDYEEQIKNNVNYKNVIFDIEAKYDNSSTRYCFIDIFKNLGTYSNGIKKAMISLLNYYIWEDGFTISDIKSLNDKKLIKDGIMFDIIRKEDN